ERLWPPTAASVHSQHTEVVCGLPEPTSASSTRALCTTGVALSTLSILVGSGLYAGLLLPRGGFQSRACCMRVRCFASSEPQSPLTNLGQVDALLPNGQHQLHRGEDSLNPGQHNHQEGQDQTQHGQLLHLPRKEADIAGLLHHHQWQDQDLPGECILQPRDNHHIFSESLLPQTQDALDENGPHLRVWARNVSRKQHHYRESATNTGLTLFWEL
ncbi:hypothetical protein NQD34_006214, partial [Periophthalmus magnuspinnatus]